MEDEHIRRMIAGHRTRLHLLEEREATLGFDTPPAVILEIQHIKTKLAELEQQAARLTVPHSAAPLRELVPETQRPPRHPGLMLLVSTLRPGEELLSQSPLHSIRYHHDPQGRSGLRVCWLIASGGEHGSLDVAERLAAECRKLGVTPRLWTVGDPWSVQATFELVQDLFAVDVPAQGLAEHEVICDFTGSVKPMSAGMILACGESRTMQYMTGRKAGIASVPMLVRFSNRKS
jgi:hypothetical protein